MNHEQRQLTVAGLSAYVEVYSKLEQRRVVLCRACGASSPPLAPDHETDWFERHAAENRAEHHRARSKRDGVTSRT
jgi:hypothetical protein